MTAPRTGRGATDSTACTLSNSAFPEPITMRTLASHSPRTTHDALRRAGIGFLLLYALGGAISTRAQVNLSQISADPFTNASSQHATEVEPDTFSFGST